jgi:hypothetical protein
MIKENDKIRLKNGNVVLVSEVLGDGAAFIVEYFKSGYGYTTDQINRDEIVSVFVETEQPLAIA